MKILDLIKSFLFFTIAILVTLFAIDFFVQGSGVMSVSFDEVDKKNGAMYKNGAKTMFLNEGFFLGAINDYRYLGPSYSPEKPKNTFRIALLGDSFVEGFQVFYRHHFRSLLENKLNNRDGKSYQVLNFGRGEFNLSNTYAYKKNFAERFSPDLTLVFLSKADLYNTEANYVLKPYYFIEDSSLKIKEDVSEHPVYKRKEFINNFSNHFAQLRLLSNCYRLVQKGMMNNIVFDKFYTAFADEVAEIKLEDDVESVDDISPEIELILEDISRKNDIILVLRDDEPFPKDIMKYFNELGLKTIDVSVILRKLTEQGHTPRYWKVTGKTGHWNHETHKAVAEYLDKELEKHLP